MDELLDVSLRAELEQRRGEWPAIARRCEVSYSWVSKFVRGQIPNPGYATLKRLHSELKAGGTDGAPDVPATATEATDAV